MEKPQIDAITVRLDRLERENRRWRRGGLIALIGGIVFLTGAHFADEPKAIEAERFVIRGKDGKVRGEFAAQSEQGQRLVLLDDNHNERIRLSVDPQGVSTLKLLNENGKDGVVLSILQRRSMVDLCDNEGHRIVNMSIYKGKSYLFLNRPIDNDNPEPRPGISISVGSKAAGTLLYDASGRVRASMELSELGTPRLQLSGEPGGEKATLEIPFADPPTLKLQAGSGKTLFQAPSP
jgi:hypothetical protein